jgi:hypothetical protein
MEKGHGGGDPELVYCFLDGNSRILDRRTGLTIATLVAV